MNKLQIRFSREDASGQRDQIFGPKEIGENIRERKYNKITSV